MESSAFGLLRDFPQAVGITDSEGFFIYTNPRFEALFGYEEGELLGMPGFILNAPSDEDPGIVTQKIIQSFEEFGVWTGKVHCKKKDGTLFWTRAKLSRVQHEEEGEFWWGVQEDITNEKALEEQLLRSQKMEAMGVMAGGIAHEFNNMLSVIQGNLELIMMEQEQAAYFEEDLTNIMYATRSAAELVHQLLLFARQESSEKQKFEPYSALARARKLVQATTSTTKIRLECPREGCALHANPTQFHQICLNLLNNAVQASPPSGSVVKIIADRLTPQELPANIDRLELRRASYIFRVRFIDSGHGISPQDLPRIFDPFFTTKKAGQGTGLGLSIVAKLIRDNEGEISVTSNQPGGTEFAVYLPGFNDATPSLDIKARSPLPSEHANILVVDDQERLTQIYTKYLRDQGHQITMCNSAQEAMDHVLSTSDDFDLICTDLAMPGMTGKELVAALKNTGLQAPIMVMTGRLSPEEQEELADMGVTDILLKPVPLEELHLRIQQCLRRKNAASNNTGAL